MIHHPQASQFTGRSPRAPHTTLAWIAAAALVVASGCNTDLILYFLGASTTTNPPPEMAITFVKPATTQNAPLGAPAEIQWADIAPVAGTFITLKVDRIDPTTREIISELQLIASRDAQADGDNDLFDWDVTGVIVGTYQPVITIQSPNGQTQTTSAPGDFNVTSTVPVPTLTFTNPGATDVTIPNPGSTTITWTDNGVANPDTRITLQLDPTSGSSGDERTIAQNISAGADGNNGSFNFDRNDVDGNPVPPGTYTLIATLVDDIHDNGQGGPITVSAVGRIILDP